MNKILIIGQAPPKVKQDLPYDTTMLYEWFAELGISKEQSKNLFEFDAVYDKFPGFSKCGGHLKPTEEQMNDYWQRSLLNKVVFCKSIIVLGRVAENYIKTKNIKKEIIYLMHPSKRNSYLFSKNKDVTLNKLKNLINK